MNTTNLIVGILIIILGGAIMLIAMVLGIIQFAGGLYEDVVAFPAGLSASVENAETDSFDASAGDELSLWLKLPNREIENKDFALSVSMIEHNGGIIKEFGEDFRIGYVRNSSGRGQYYKLGSHRFEEDFSGYLSRRTDGTWNAPYDGLLVLRRSNPLSFPSKHIALFVVGIIPLIIGIRHLARSRKAAEPGN